MRQKGEKVGSYNKEPWYLDISLRAKSGLVRGTAMATRQTSTTAEQWESSMPPLQEMGSIGAMSLWDAAERLKRQLMPKAPRQCPKPGCRQSQPCPTHPQGWAGNTSEPLPDNWDWLRRNTPKTGCQWINGNGSVCGSWSKLELDHRIPRAEGGTNSFLNLQWLCHYHHQLKTIQESKRGKRKKG